MTYPIVKLTWRDAESEAGWFPVAEAHKRTIAPVISVGYLIAETATTYTLAGAVSQDGQLVGDLQLIPKDWATSEVTEI